MTGKEELWCPMCKVRLLCYTDVNQLRSKYATTKKDAVRIYRFGLEGTF